MPRQPLTPAQRSLRARIAANARISKPNYDARTATQKANDARWAKYEAQVDPDNLLSATARREKAKHAMKADMDRGKLKASRTRTAQRKAA